jgi:hypothetical protein
MRIIREAALDSSVRMNRFVPPAADKRADGQRPWTSQ